MLKMCRTILILIISLIKAKAQTVEQFYTNCQDSSYGCFVNGETDCEKQNNCTFGATWKGVSETEYQFQIIGSSTPDNYVAIGFPAVSGMSPAPVIGCSRQFKEAAIYYNNEQYNSLPAFNHSDFVSSYKVVAEDNITSCDFVMKSNFTVAENNKTGETEYDLNTNPIYVIMAVGPVNKDGVMQYHSNVRNKSASLIDLTHNNEFYTPSGVNQFYTNCQNSKVYGCFTSSDDCRESKDCTFGATWKGISETEYQFQTLASSSTPESYVAIGFPAVSGMSPAPVIGCSRQFKEAAIYYNNEQYNSLPAFNHSDFVSSYKVVEEDNITSCDFVMKSNFTVTENNKTGETEYDLNINTTYVIMAMGPVNKDGVMQYHNNVRNKSTSLIDLTDHNEFYEKNGTNHNNNTGGAIYDNCYEDKGCFGIPYNCEKQRNCDMIITYTKVKQARQEGKEKYKFEIGGKMSQGYTAAGLSLDNNMGDDSVMACVQSPTNQSLSVQMYWNTASPYNSLRLAQPQLGLSDISLASEDGMYTCTFLREAVTNITIPGENTTSIFDLDNTKYYLLLASGPVDSGEDKIKRHTVTGKTGESVDLGDFSQVSGDKGTLIKLHASFMVLAWLLCANLGTFTARYCKDIFTGKQIMSVAVWFQVHRVSMILCVLLSVAGLVPVIIDKKLQPIKDQKLHPLLGLTVLVVAFVQPIIAYFRPGKDARFRPLFKFVHTALGYSAIILAIASIFLTNDLETKFLHDWGTYMMYAFSGWLGLSHLAMTGYFCVKEGEAQTGFDDNPLVRAGLNVFVVGILGLSAAVIMSVVLK